jgi:hypothetical protein
MQQTDAGAVARAGMHNKTCVMYVAQILLPSLEYLSAWTV